MKSTTTSQSIRALLDRLIDFAGLFPPAKLDMAATVRNYAQYSVSGEAWMLGRLIIPAARLNEFESHAGALLPRKPNQVPDMWQISALASAAGSDELTTDLALIEDFNMRHEEEQAGRAIIDVLELKADSSASIDAGMEVISDDLYPFFEIPIQRDPSGMIEMLAEVEAGAKVRTGGPTADLYPTPSDLARFICACAEAGVPFKATAGMHHPLRHFSDAVKADEHGFLNVFVAACLAQTNALGPADVQAVLEETSIEAFTIDDDGISWNGQQVESASIEDVRAEFALSFGSCSFDEPREALRALGLL
jgi:hypothetical protein